jgi:hypothetical protein
MGKKSLNKAIYSLIALRLGGPIIGHENGSHGHRPDRGVFRNQFGIIVGSYRHCRIIRGKVSRDRQEVQIFFRSDVLKQP